MSPKPTIDENEWLKFKQDVQIIKEKLKLAEVKQQHNLTATNTDLTGQEKAVLNYVKANPGSSKQALVDGMKDLYSRAPIFRTIDNLITYGMLVQRKDKKNRQTYNLFINSESVIVTLVEDLETYKRNFSEVISWAQKMERRPISSVAQEKRALLSAVLEKLNEKTASILELMHFCFIISYFVTALFKWPLLAPDKETQAKLYAIFFSSIQEIQFELIKFVPQFYDQGNIHDMGKEVAGGLPLTQIIQYFSGLSPVSKLMESPLFAGMNKALMSIMDLIWKNSYDFIDFKDEKGTKIKDWQELEKYRTPEVRKKSAETHKKLDKILKFVKQNPDFFGLGDNQELI